MSQSRKETGKRKLKTSPVKKDLMEINELVLGQKSGLKLTNMESKSGRHTPSMGQRRLVM